MRSNLTGLSRHIAGFIIFWISLGCFAAETDSAVSVAWKSVPGAAGYFIYYGSNPRDYSARLDAGTNTTATIPGLTRGGTNYFVITAYATNGLESPPSSEVQFVVPGRLFMNTGWLDYDIAPRLHFAVAPGQSYEVQTTSDLVNWLTILQTSTEVTNSWIAFSDPTLTNNSAPHRFYRLVVH